MGENSFLKDLVVTLVAALLVIVPSRRFKIPAAVPPRPGADGDRKRDAT